ncbi:MAG: cysteine--tRNA ligase [Deltaproteobacteria bacterium]|nr:cysteine--tRNA ligase [Deltaproteobacteria bacterium]
MPLTLYDTLSARKRTFEPLKPGHVGIYVCGVTVYDYVHIGHARSATVFDVMVRHLRESGFIVTYVRNITDIDDKIIKRALESGEETAQVAERFIEAFRQDMRVLNLLPADIEPKVSEHLQEIYQLISELIEKGYAYQAEGDVYFSVSRFPGYGKLSHRSLVSLATGASGRLNDAELERKRDPVDFALWKGAKPGELGWDSPWGRGRPGWHIECSAMSMRYLGETFDIHGGGLDLVFPHHENEIAQSEAATGKPFANFWVHNGFVEVAKQKMSKSLGNFFTARECYRFFEPEALRYFALTVHYRAPLNLDWVVDEAGRVTGFPSIEEAERRVEYIYNTQLRLKAVSPKRIREDAVEIPEEIALFPERLAAALDDDLNLPVALAVTHEFLKQVNELSEPAGKRKIAIARKAVEAAENGFLVLGRVLGLGYDDPSRFLSRVRERRAKARGITPEQIEKAIDERIAARKKRDFIQADAIRSRLAENGIELMDGPEGTTWHIP